MKRVILSLMAMVVAASMMAQVRPQNNHTVSTTLGAGLEYGFEWAFAGQASVVARVGMVSKDFILRSGWDNFQWSATMSPGVTLEPRYYLLMTSWPFRPSWASAGPLPGIGSTSFPPARTCFACLSSSRRRACAIALAIYSKAI